MRIGLLSGDVAGKGGIDAIINDARVGAEQGFPSLWLAQIFGIDAITVAAVVGREVPGIELGTAVVPTYPRHPMMLAQQALTANAITGGRFNLGIGLSHQIVIEQMMKLSFDKPVRHMREYLSVLRPLIHERNVSFEGETLGTQAAIDVPNAEPCPILVAALGPKMLELAGEMADGTITWMTGANTLADHTIPTISAAAEAAGRPKPRIVASVPVCVTNDVDHARTRAAKALVAYGFLPSYRAMLDREGLDGPADLAIIGDEDTVRSGIEAYAAIGVDDFLAAEITGAGEEAQRTRDVLRSLL